MFQPLHPKLCLCERFESKVSPSISAGQREREERVKEHSDVRRTTLFTILGAIMLNSPPRPKTNFLVHVKEMKKERGGEKKLLLRSV